MSTSTADRSRRPAVVLVALLTMFFSACSTSEDGEEGRATGDSASGEDTTTTSAPDDDTTTSAAEPTPSSDETTTTGDTTTTTESLPDPVLPATLWGIETGTFDLVEVRTDSGEVLTRIAGWGPDAADPDGEGGAQALTDVEYANDTVWVGDCCEPAVGSVFRVEPVSSPSVPEAATRVNGTSPVLSADASLLAVAVLDIGIAIHDGATGDLLIAPDLVGAQLTPPENAGELVFATPLTWLDEATLAVAITVDGVSTITLVSVEDLVAAAVDEAIEVDGTVIDGTTRRDGALVLAIEGGDETIESRVFDPATGDELEVVPLPATTSTIDYDRSGTYLLVGADDGTLTWEGDGESGSIDTPLFGASWS